MRKRKTPSKNFLLESVILTQKRVPKSELSQKINEARESPLKVYASNSKKMESKIFFLILRTSFKKSFEAALYQSVERVDAANSHADLQTQA